MTESSHEPDDGNVTPPYPSPSAPTVPSVHPTSASTTTAHLLYAKAKVYRHPTRSAADNIDGYLALLQHENGQHDSSPSGRTATNHLLLAWVPLTSLQPKEADSYAKVDLHDQDTPYTPPQSVTAPPVLEPLNDGHSVDAFSVDLSDIFSLQVRPPNKGWWHGSIIVHTRHGRVSSPLFFHDNECESTTRQRRKLVRQNLDPFSEAGNAFWGGDEVVRWVKRYARVERCQAEPNLFLIDPSAEDLANFNAVKPPPKRLGSKSLSTDAGERPNSPKKPLQEDPLAKFVKETGWNLLERFSRVTTFSRRVAQDVMDHPRMPPHVRRLVQNPEVQTLQQEFDSARVYLARWAMGMAEQREREQRRRELEQRQRKGEVWTIHDVRALEQLGYGGAMTAEGNQTLLYRRDPVTLQEWKSFFSPSTGELVTKTVDEVKERVFHGGLADDHVRKEAWLFLLGVYDWHSTSDERRVLSASLRDEYYRLKQSWWNRLDGLGGDTEEGEWWRDQRNRIEKDVHRTDRFVLMFAGEDVPHPDPESPFAESGTNVHLELLKEMLLTYNEYNRELGYVQGMSDLLAPIYAIVQDDAMAFWAFRHFMDRMQRNFLQDQSGMRAQLVTLQQLVEFLDPELYEHLLRADSTNFFFFFRMLLVWFKREFAWDDILRLWEGLWTDYRSNQFHLFVALAILERHRDVIREHLKHFDEILKYINELANTMTLDSILYQAEVLFLRFQHLVAAVDAQGQFPEAKRGATSTSSVPAPGAGSDKAARTQIVTPELRKLLARDVTLLYVGTHGGDPLVPGRLGAGDASRAPAQTSNATADTTDGTTDDTKSEASPANAADVESDIQSNVESTVEESVRSDVEPSHSSQPAKISPSPSRLETSAETSLAGAFDSEVTANPWTSESETASGSAVENDLTDSVVLVDKDQCDPKDKDQKEST